MEGSVTQIVEKRKHKLKTMEGMTFLPLSRDKKHKFKNGHWTWHENGWKLKFHSHEGTETAEPSVRQTSEAASGVRAPDDKQQQQQRRKNHSDVGLRFVNHIDETEERVFFECLQQRPDSCGTADVITLRDIKDLSLFTLRSAVSKEFIEFLYTPCFDAFLRAAIFYFDLYLRVLELLLIWRDELSEDNKLKSMHSMQIERDLSQRLSDRRLLFAREYSDVLTREGQRKLVWSRDRKFYEALIDFTTQCTFIAMHRRCFNAISCELNRLFRTEFFNIVHSSNSRNRCHFEFTFREQQILYGQKSIENSSKHYRRQHSPLIAQMAKLSPSEAQILTIGREKYRGSDEYLFNLELQFTVPECHLRLIGQTRGILGHPKGLYDVMLQLNRDVVIRMNYGKHYDPYGLARFVTIDTRISTATADAARAARKRYSKHKSLSTRLIIHRAADGGAGGSQQLKLWKRERESIMRRSLAGSQQLPR